MSENNFESLRRLLAIKRHELPPPGYFNNFSSQVVARIRAGETDVPDSLSERLLAGAPWLVNFFQVFEVKPAFTGAFASALCLLLLFGAVFAERPDAATQPLLAQATESSAPLAAISPAVALPKVTESNLLASGGVNPSLNLQPSLQPVAMLFGQQNPFAQQVSFNLPGN
jgi:hypothetical protein